MEEVVDNRGDALVTLVAVNISKLRERKKCMERNNLCPGNVYCTNTNKV